MKYSDFNEIEQRGTVAFPVSYYCVTPQSERYVMPPHWHKDFEIIRIISGEFRAYLNNVPYTLTKGDIIFVQCGTLHRGEPDNCIYECIVLDLNLLRKKQNDTVSSFITPVINGRLGINRILNNNDDLIYAVANALFSAMKTKEGFYELEVVSLLLKLFSLFYKENSFFEIKKNQNTSKQAQNIIKLIDWIEENYTEIITLEKLSEVSGLNPKYICRIFKEYTSKTPINYINEKRIEAACHEMTMNGSSVTKAAYDCGFNDLSYFSKIFKTHKGITPKEYKKSKNLV